jgi:putative membrane protein
VKVWPPSLSVVRLADDLKSSLRTTRCEDACVADPDPRFTMANERTFLAWNRTALAFIAGGIAIEQFVDADRAARLVVSVPLILLGGFVGVAGYVRWRRSEDAMKEGAPIGESRMPLFLAATFVAIALGALALVIASSR